MTPEPLQLDELSEPHVQIMQAYAVRTAAGKSTEDFDGWLERVSVLDGFAPEELVQRHGEMIALGFLKFEISNADLGLRYQISTRGKQALDRALARQKADEEKAAAEAEEAAESEEAAEAQADAEAAADEAEDTATLEVSPEDQSAEPAETATEPAVRDAA